jgi:hypothetical protein
MHIHKHYLHDRNILLLNGLNGLLALFGFLAVILRLDVSQSTHIIQYRSNLLGDPYKSGSVSELRALAFFMIITLLASVVLSIRIYPHRRVFAVTVLALSTMLLVVGIVISNSLLLVN